ncbi:MAG: DUF2780 domain-containing protein [Methylococcaceae bacterium]
MTQLKILASIILLFSIIACAPGYQNYPQTANTFPSASQTPINPGIVAGINQAASSPLSTTPTLNPSSIAIQETPVGATTPALVNILAQQLGVSQQQALGGAGSLFSVAQQAMPASQFGQVSSVVPGISQILAATPSLNPSSPSLLGLAGNALGTNSGLGRLASAAIAFQNLGLNPSMVNQFIPIMLQYVQNQGGAATMGLLQNVLLPQ